MFITFMCAGSIENDPSCTVQATAYMMLLNTMQLLTNLTALVKAQAVTYSDM